MRTGTNLRSLERAATAALAMDRINEMYLEDPPSERDLYNMGRRGPMKAEVYEFDNYYVGY